MSKHNRLTVKGQVTIPRDVRAALGVKAGDPVSFEPRSDGTCVIKKATELSPAEFEARYQAALTALDDARLKFPMKPLGMTTDEYMALIREPVPLPDKP
jgi:AbrB family looped-hinge helix DNA binding protein